VNTPYSLNTYLEGPLIMCTGFFSLSEQEENRQKMLLGADLPVIAVNDWLSVRNILSDEVVGQIRVLLAVGLGTQIYRLTMMLDEENEPTTSCPTLNSSAHIKESVVETAATSDHTTEESSESAEIDDDSDSDSSTWLEFHIKIEEARNLPLIHVRATDKREPPCTYTTVGNGVKTFRSDMMATSCNPKWGYESRITLPDQLLVDPKQRQLIIKVWHTDSTEEYVIGFAAVDLGILLHDGFSKICGW
jgi:hypothetical protein